MSLYYISLFPENPADDATTYTPLLEDAFVVTSSFIGKLNLRLSMSILEHLINEVII
jgi:hypothetical protein